MRFLAGVVGIEPTLTVLETAVLPLYDTPSEVNYMKSKAYLQAETKLFLF